MTLTSPHPTFINLLLLKVLSLLKKMIKLVSSLLALVPSVAELPSLARFQGALAFH
jgi:hypothetical protein